MIIHLNKEYFLEDIPYNVVLRRSYISLGTGNNKAEKPKLVTQDIGFYNSVETAIAGYVKEIVTTKTADFDGNLEEYIKRITDITNNAINEIRGYAK